MYVCVIEGVTERVQRIFVFVNRVHEREHAFPINLYNDQPFYARALLDYKRVEPIVTSAVCPFSKLAFLVRLNEVVSQ